METIDILVKCPSNVYKDLEETCINTGTNPSDYLLNLYYAEGTRFHADKERREKGDKWADDEEPEENELKATSTKGMPDKFYKANTKDKKK